MRRRRRRPPAGPLPSRSLSSPSPPRLRARPLHAHTHRRAAAKGAGGFLRPPPRARPHGEASGRKGRGRRTQGWQAAAARGVGGGPGLLGLGAFQAPPRRPKGSREGSLPPPLLFPRRGQGNGGRERALKRALRRGGEGSQAPQRRAGGRGLRGSPRAQPLPLASSSSSHPQAPRSDSLGRLSPPRAPARPPADAAAVRPGRTSHAPDAAASGPSCSPSGAAAKLLPGGSQRRSCFPFLPSVPRPAKPDRAGRAPRRAAHAPRHRLRPVEVPRPAAPPGAS